MLQIYALFALWKTSRIRKFLYQSTTFQLIDSFVTYRMDYSNSLLFGLPSHEVMKIQIRQNYVVCLITKTRRCDHKTPIIQGLHWLLLHQCIEFKLCCTTYKIIYRAAPTYLNELLSIYAPPRKLRSNSTGGVMLSQPIPCYKFYGERVFSVSPSHLWNSLSLELRFIRSYSRFTLSLRTHLFNEYYLACIVMLIFYKYMFDIALF